jgi:MFS transporter, MHS family, proline/betaine transporter
MERVAGRVRARTLDAGEELAPSPSRGQVLAAGAASVLGWSFDLFDLFIILYLAPTLGVIFFPSSQPTLSLAAVYASFAVTLLMRPIGSAVFGPFADRHGRRQAMIVATFGTGIATALMGTLPTIQQGGIAAPLLFLLLRLIQGVFVGGVVASTHTLGTETVPPRWRGLMSGMVGGGGGAVGSLLASIAFFVVSSLFPGPAFAVWGWRVMFFTGLLGSLLSVFVYLSVHESPIWAEQARRPRGGRTSLGSLFAGEFRAIMLINLLVTLGAGTQYYLTSGYMPTFLSVVNKVPGTVAGQMLILSSAIVIVVAPLVGHLSTFTGRRRMLLITGIVNLIGLPLAYVQLAHLVGGSVGEILPWMLIVTTLGNGGYAPVLIFLNERFPTAIRASGVALSWNIGFAIGGMTPTFATGLAGSIANIPTALIAFLVVALILYLVGVVRAPAAGGQLV